MNGQVVLTTINNQEEGVQRLMAAGAMEEYGE